MARWRQILVCMYSYSIRYTWRVQKRRLQLAALLWLVVYCHVKGYWRSRHLLKVPAQSSVPLCVTYSANIKEIKDLKCVRWKPLHPLMVYRPFIKSDTMNAKQLCIFNVIPTTKCQDRHLWTQGNQRWDETRCPGVGHFVSPVWLDAPAINAMLQQHTCTCIKNCMVNVVKCTVKCVTDILNL